MKLLLHRVAIISLATAVGAGTGMAADSTIGKAWLGTHLEVHPAGEGCAGVFESDSIPTAICDYSGIREEVHDLDVVYTVLAGGGSLAVGDETATFDDDSVIYVKAGTAHLIRADEGTRAVAFFSNGVAAADAPDIQVYDLADARAEAKADENVWSPFHQGASLVYGLYQLPVALDGDDTLTHPVDEINLVIKGDAAFHMDEEVTNVRPGSIVWVSQGVGHYFDNLSESFEVLILFHRPPRTQQSEGG